MKKNIIYGCMALTLVSCGDASEENITKAAKELCDCMDNRKETREESEFLDPIDLDILDYGFCSLDVASKNIDPESEDFGKAIKKSCPEVFEIQQQYIKESIEE